MDRLLRRRLETRFASELTGPVRQRHDATEIRIGPAALTSVMAALHDERELDFAILADLAGVETGNHMQCVCPLWWAKPPDWLRVTAEPLPREDPRIPSITGLCPGA